MVWLPSQALVLRVNFHPSLPVMPFRRQLDGWPVGMIEALGQFAEVVETSTTLVLDLTTGGQGINVGAEMEVADLAHQALAEVVE
jgi:hypothetical protein